MRPIVEEQVSEVFVVIGGCWTVDQNATEDTIPCLNGKVGVIPRRAILSCAPGVGEAVAGSNWALGDGRDAVYSKLALYHFRKGK